MKESWKIFLSFQGHNTQTNHLTASHVQNNRIFVPHCSNIYGMTTERKVGLLQQENLIKHPYNLFRFKFYHCKIFTCPSECSSIYTTHIHKLCSNRQQTQKLHIYM